MPSSIFNHLEKFNIIVPAQDRLYPWFMVYDFEAILSHVPENHPTPRLKWLRRHDPISVSVSSNVPGFTSAQGFVNQEPTVLIQDMMNYMSCIADSVYEAAQQKTWAPVITKLEYLIQHYEQQLEKLEDKKDDTTKELKKKTMGKQLEKIARIVGIIPALLSTSPCTGLQQHPL